MARHKKAAPKAGWLMPGQGPKPVTPPSPSTSDGEELDENEVKKMEEDLKEVKRRNKILKRELAARVAGLAATTAAVEQVCAVHAGWVAVLDEFASRGAVIPGDCLDPLTKAFTALAEMLQKNAATVASLLPVSPAISVDSADDERENMNETLVAMPPVPELASEADLLGRCLATDSDPKEYTPVGHTHAAVDGIHRLPPILTGHYHPDMDPTNAGMRCPRYFLLLLFLYSIKRVSIATMTSRMECQISFLGTDNLISITVCTPSLDSESQSSMHSDDDVPSLCDDNATTA